MSQLAQGETTIEGPTTQTRALVRREALPQEFTSLGIVAFADGETGMKLTLQDPRRVESDKANVLMPVEIVQQDDPNWRPSRTASSDSTPDAKNGAHFYPQAGGNSRPRKQALSSCSPTRPASSPIRTSALRQVSASSSGT